MSNFTVENTNDNGAGSLRQAIEDANATSGADSIQFDSELSGQEIILTSGELEISDSVEISGNGVDITINGNNNSRIFNVDDLDANAENLTVSQSRFTNNENTSLEPTDGGGAITNSASGSVDIDSSLIASNQSSAFGGGITNFGELSVEDSIIFDNTVTSGGGGGIDNRGSTIDITGTIIANNINTANPAGGFGNGTPESTTIVTDSLIFGNEALDGAGFFVNAGNVELINSAVLNNEAQNNGGGAALTAEGSLEVNGSLIAFNSSEVNGGGIASLGGSVTVNESSIFGNEALTGSDDGIFNDGGSLEVNSSFI